MKTPRFDRINGTWLALGALATLGVARKFVGRGSTNTEPDKKTLSAAMSYWDDFLHKYGTSKPPEWDDIVSLTTAILDHQAEEQISEVTSGEHWYTVQKGRSPNEHDLAMLRYLPRHRACADTSPRTLLFTGGDDKKPYEVAPEYYDISASVIEHKGRHYLVSTGGGPYVKYAAQIDSRELFPCLDGMAP